MRQWKQIVLAAGLALGISAAFSTDSSAAGKVTGVQQIDDGRDYVKVQCDAVLGAEYYYLEMSPDNKTWTTMDVSTSPSSLYTYNLNAGKSYYARVGLCTDYDGNQKVAGTVSDAVEVVTAPYGTVDTVQSGAKTNGVTVRGTAISGANYYILSTNNTIVGASTSNTVTATKLNPGASYWMSFYACRRSASGYIAVGSYDWARFKTLAPALNTRNFGVTSSWLNINSFTFTAATSYEKDGVQFQFATPKGKVKKNVYSSSNSAYVDKFIEGHFYKYRVRTYVQCGTGRAYSAWSGYKYIGVPKKGNLKFSRNGKSISFSFSKVKDATGYIVYTSTKENSGYKKVKKLSAKKRSVTVKKIGGKKLKKGKTYYFKVIPIAKVKKKTYKSSSNAVYYVKRY